MADRLTGYKVTEEKIEHPFRDSIVTNLTKLVDVLPKLNVTNDPELDRLAEQVRAALLVDPNELRKSDTVGIETAKNAGDITLPCGVIFSSYSSLISTAKSAARRLDQIQKWLGREPVIILDEAHKAKNALASGKR